MDLELSFCLIVKNEAPYLRNCVESFGAIYDELIIVDTGSTDATVEIAEDLLRDREGRLEHFAWCDDFAAARNYACSLARAPWILMVDADEYLSPDQHPSVILETIRKTPPHIRNLLLIDLTLQDGQVILAHPVNRLFRNHPEIKWEGRIHESLSVIAQQQRMTQIRLIHENSIKRMENARLHPDISQMYERGLVADAKATPESSRPVFYLGNTLAEREDWAAARKAYERYLKMAGPDGWQEEVWQAYQNIALCCNRLDDPKGCREALIQAVSVDPRRSETYLALGDCAMDAGNLEEARIWYQFATTLPTPASTIFVDTHAYGLKPWWKLGSVLIQQQDYVSALLATEKAVQLAPQDPNVIERLRQLRWALLDQAEPPTVIILSRRPELAHRCLEALLRTEGEVYYETIVVCDGDMHGFEDLVERYPRLRIVSGRAPFIYSRNANIGIEACQGDVVLLNDDAIPETPGWLDLLHRAAHSRPDAGPVSPLLSQCGNPLQDARIAPATGRTKSSDSALQVTEAPFVTFTCVYLRRDLYDRVGPLDQGFVWYGWEDNDYCQRAIYSGYRPLVTRDVLVRHDHPSASYRSPQQNHYFLQARNYFERKHLKSAASCDLFIRIRYPQARIISSLRRLLAVTSQDCRMIWISSVKDRAFADALRGLADPRIALRFCDTAPKAAQVLDELSGGSAQVVVEVAPDVMLPNGWLDALLRRYPAETDGLGVLAIPMQVNAPVQAAVRSVGGIQLIPAQAGDSVFLNAPVHLVGRNLLDGFGPISGSCVALPAWHYLSLKLERRRHINGFVYPVVPVTNANDEVRQ
jgi:GT2 family glycosyltransferase/cytochrome c-type biogenesis protein CcmH/NrfG